MTRLLTFLREIDAAGILADTITGALLFVTIPAVFIVAWGMGQ